MLRSWYLQCAVAESLIIAGAVIKINDTQDVCSRQEDCEPINPVLDAILSYVSNIGIVLSIIGLILTIITMLAFK